jgi:MFS transporter, DHA1 family, multidrug resistance protein
VAHLKTEPSESSALKATQQTAEQTAEQTAQLAAQQAAHRAELAAIRPRAVLIAIAIVAGFAELAYAVMNVSAMPVYLKLSMGYSVDAVTGIGTAFLICEGVMKGPFGILGDRIGRKYLIIAGPLISVVTSLLTLLIQPGQWYLFVLLRLLDGLGAAALWTSALAMIADLVEEDRRSQAMSLFNVTYMVGIALGPFIGGAANDITHILLPRVDPRTASFYVISVLFLVTAAIAWWRLPNLRPHHEHHPGDMEGGLHLSALLHSLKKIPEMLAMAFVTFFGIGMIMLIIKLFAMEEFHVTETHFGALLLVPCLVIAGASVPLGTVGDRIGKTKAIRVGLGICAFSMMAMGFIKHEMVLVIGGSLIGVGFVIAFPSWMAYISSSCPPSQRGAIMGAVGTAQGLGAMIGVPLGGFLYEHGHLPFPIVPKSLVGYFPFLRIDTAGSVVLNSHFAPFAGCTALLLTAFLIAAFKIKDTPKA